MSKFCTNCGSKLEEGAKVCAECNEPVEEEAVKAEEEPKRLKKKKK